MKRIFSFILATILFAALSACQSAQGAAEKQVPMPPAEMPTLTPLPTNTPLPTATPTLQPVVYSVSFGYCQTDHALTGDPTRLKECVVKQKKHMELAAGDTIKYSCNLPHVYASFCTIHQLDGKYVASFVDSQKFGEALCSLP